ncbi:MAG: hypothetical protein ABN502_16125, partial [Gammaproteobacteria bacterium]
METIIVAAVLAVLAVPVLLLVALVSISGLKRRVSELERQLAELRQAAPRPVSEPPRKIWRLHSLRRWSYEQSKQVLPGSPGTVG